MDYPKLIVSSGTKITRTKQAALLARDIADQHVEFLVVISINDGMMVMNARIVSIGGTREAIVPISGIFKGAIIDGATGIVIVHNHPNGEMKPSKADIRTTKKIMKAGKIIGISVLDSVIIHGKDYRSILKDVK